MDQTVKANWVAALESGKYEQATGCLNSGRGMCCLGVLTDLYGKEKGLSWARESLDQNYHLGGLEYLESGLAGKEVLDWSGISTRAGSLPFVTRDTYKFHGEDQVDPDDISYQACLSELNDGGVSFSQIADLIKAFL